jgi:hypothetical protein
MPTTLTHEAGLTFRLDVGGTLHHEDMVHWQAVLAGEIEKRGPVRLLVVLNRFSGWGEAEGWNDMSFYATYGDRIVRIAIVAEDRWRDQAMMFVGAGSESARGICAGRHLDCFDWLAE